VEQEEQLVLAFQIALALALVEAAEPLVLAFQIALALAVGAMVLALAEGVVVVYLVLRPY
jgi:hypothetical protein